MGFSNPTGGQVTVSSNVNANITNPDGSPVPVKVLTAPDTNYTADNYASGESDTLFSGTVAIIAGVAGKRIYVASIQLCITPDATTDNELALFFASPRIASLRWKGGASPYSLVINPNVLGPAGTSLDLQCTVGGKSDFTYAITYTMI